MKPLMSNSRPAFRPNFVCQSCQIWLGSYTQSPRRPFSLFGRSGKLPPPKGKGARNGKPEINWFEQTGGKNAPIKPDEDIQETERLKARIDRLEEELQEMRKSGVEAFPSELMQLLEAEVVKNGRVPGTSSSLALGESSDLDDINMLKRLSTSLNRGKAIASDGTENIARSTVKMPTRKEQRAYLNRLNGYLKQAEVLGMDEPTRKQLWRWYVRCKQNIPHFLQRVSRETWDTLWNAQAVKSPSNPDRAAHLKILAHDIVASGHQLSPAQRVGYIEALFAQGEPTKAIHEWLAAEASPKDEVVSEAFYALGVRMFAKNDVQKAHEIAYSALNEEKAKDARILLPVIRAWANDGGNIALRRAWAAYIRLREMLGREITMQDYDRVCKSFLDAGRADLALGVFKDMMLTGQHLTDHDSTMLFRKALGTVGGIQMLAADGPELNKISLEALTVLPRRLENKFFFGSWIKKLLGAGDADSAALVVELMSTRGVQPDAKYVNGIIGAWIRNGDARSYEKAEKMAWDMIERRKTFAWKRRVTKRGHNFLGSSSESLIDFPSEYTGTCRTAATMETFSILMESYLARQKHEQIRWLHRSIRLAEIEPDAFFMKCLLKSQLKTDGLRKVWQTYTEWAQEPERPAPRDVELYDFLWDCALLRADRTPALSREALEGDGNDVPQDSETARPSVVRATMRKQHGFPSPRALFGDMMNWFVGSKPKRRDDIRETFSPIIYHKIVKALLQDGTGDLVGVIVVMHALKQHLGMFPDEHIGDLLVTHLAKMEAQQGPRQPGGHHIHVLRVTERIADLAANRMKALEREGVERSRPEDVGRFKNEENLLLLSKFLRGVVAKNKDVGDLEHAIQRAAWDMGVGGIDTGDQLDI
ncbi:MAG: hypothetical protein M1823_001389 [Watsoniomyces obsoletus]|nr:MAG: hypothetical protein M1823_001389 [Watsoniomyces obsoletus]